MGNYPYVAKITSFGVTGKDVVVHMKRKDDSDIHCTLQSSGLVRHVDVYDTRRAILNGWVEIGERDDGKGLYAKCLFLSFYFDRFNRNTRWMPEYPVWKGKRRVPVEISGDVTLYYSEIPMGEVAEIQE